MRAESHLNSCEPRICQLHISESCVSRMCHICAPRIHESYVYSCAFKICDYASCMPRICESCVNESCHVRMNHVD